MLGGAECEYLTYSVNMGTDLSIRSELDGGQEIEPVDGMRPDVVYRENQSDLFFQPDGLEKFPGLGLRSFNDIKNEYFGGGDKWAREFAFHYAVMADFIGLEGVVRVVMSRPNRSLLRPAPTRASNSPVLAL